MNLLNQQTIEMNDLIFQNRNKAYGAYALRKAYDGNLLKSGGIASILFTSSFLIFQWVQRPYSSIISASTYCSLPFNIPPPPPPPPPRPRTNRRTLQLNVPTIAFLPPIVKKEDLIINEILPPTQEQMKNITISMETKQGDITGKEEVKEIIPPPPSSKTSIKYPTEESSFFVPHQLPQFPAGETAMYKYLAKQLRYPSKARAQDIQGTVLIHFTVTAEGSIINVTVKKGLSSECDEEAMRVVQGMPKWTPARSSGRVFNADFTIPITFKLED